jgi:NAD(P)H-flavin reductase
LESATASPQASFAGAPLHDSLAKMAGALAFALAKNHPFIDGNQRVAFLAAATFLGSRFRVFGPFGQLRIRLSHRPIILVANGSGLSPMLSMLTDLAEKRSTRKVRLFFGVRAAEDLFALEQLAEIARAMPSFDLVLVLSREWPADWRGETGSLAAAIRRRVSSAVDHDAYLCGAPWCIETTLPVLLELGIRRRNVHFDLFTPAAR